MRGNEEGPRKHGGSRSKKYIYNNKAYKGIII